MRECGFSALRRHERIKRKAHEKKWVLYSLFGRAVHAFGNANNSVNAGLAYANSNNSPGDSNANAVSQLCNTEIE